MANILIGTKVPYSPLFWSYLQKGMTMNGIWKKGPRSKVQWNGKVLLGGDYKLNTWPVDETLKNMGPTKAKPIGAIKWFGSLKHGIVNQHLLTIVCA